MKKILFLSCLLAVTMGLSAQNQNFNGWRISAKVGLLESNLNKYYGLADGICTETGQASQVELERFPFGLGNEKRNGAIIGAALGHNWASDNLLIGLEGGFYKTFMEYDFYNQNWLQNIPEGLVMTNLNLDYLADASLILGGIVAEKVLIYGKGGFTAGYFNHLDRVNVSNDRAYYQKLWNPGYTVGGGIKYAINNRYALGLEYGYSKFKDLNQLTYNKVGQWEGTFVTKQHVNLHAVMATFTIGLGQKVSKVPRPRITTPPVIKQQRQQEPCMECPPERPVTTKRQRPVVVKEIIKEREVIRETIRETETKHDFGKPEVGKIITLRAIYYDFDQDYIRPDARPDLDKVVAYMNEYPDMEIELSSHTDSRGSDSYNLDLSQRRAQSAVNYIVSRGISSWRIVAKGYGERRLVNNCSDGVNCSEGDHQSNRRTEIMITKLDGISYPTGSRSEYRRY